MAVLGLGAAESQACSNLSLKGQKPSLVQQVLLRRRREKWQGKDVFQGHVKSPERVSMEEIRDGAGRA